MFGREPVAIAAALSLAIKAILLAIMAFGVELGEKQLAAVMFATDAVLALVLVLVVRPQTVPTELANKQIEKGVASPAGTSAAAVVAAVKKEEGAA